MIRPATVEDLDGIMRAVEETKDIMHAQGNFQWDERYPVRADFESDVAQGSLYVIMEGSMVAGFACLDFNEPEAYNNASWHKPGPALILHRMAIAPRFRGLGFGGKLLEFAGAKAAETGAASIRTDTFSGNAPMNSLFIKHGFRMAGEVELPGKQFQPFHCYEK